MKSIMIVFVALTLFIGACSREMSDKQIATIEAEIRGQVELMLDAAEKLDIGALKSFIADDENTTVYLSNSALSVDSWLTEMGAIFNDLESQKVEIIQDEVIVFSPKYAMWKASAKGAVKAVDAQGISEELLTETWIWQKIDGNWKVVHYHESF